MVYYWTKACLWPILKLAIGNYFLITCQIVLKRTLISIYMIFMGLVFLKIDRAWKMKKLLKHEMFFILWHIIFHVFFLSILISTICIDLNTFSWTSGKFLFYANWRKWKYILLMVFYRLYALNNNSWYGYFTRSLVLYVCFVDRWLPFVLFLLAIVLFFLPRFKDIVLLRDVFSYWPSYRSEACCIGLRRSRTPIQQTDWGPITIGQYEKHHVMIPLLINQSNISRDFSLRLSKRVADSDLAVIGLTGIGPIRKISVLDWFFPYWPNESFYIVLTDLII